ncbi:MAG TPA: hypothetical protein PLG57_04635 [Bacteroidia bacterium]|jgi:hypothetical protein|nr:hypothetical protein [Bacteroidia bacterium]HQF27510.1 hypothetical protein [Bacteroidia bacterium]HQK97727.1 hypothetical protein [Bacteroidia bacterium]
MIPSIRSAYNASFTEEKYRRFLEDMTNEFNYEIEFRVSETPVFIDKQLKERLINAGEEIIDVLTRPDFKQLSEKAIPPHLRVPNEDNHTSLLAIDFAICKDEKGDFIPQLIELQGFASLYGYQEWLANKYRAHFEIPDNFDNKFGYSHDEYLNCLKKIIIGKQRPENVVLLEVEPWKQKTQIDFYVTRKYLGIEVICLSEVIVEGRNLFYLKDGIKTPIKRIYNRVIFDELVQRDDLKRQFNMVEDVDVEWVAHPNWFFRISKYIMPYLKNKFVPETYFVNELTNIPNDLENWVLKPLFSFSGQGVIFDIKREDFDNLKDPENFILQRKVTYAPAVASPTGEVKCEIRLLYLWDENEKRPTLTLNLGRMSKGKMIGVRYNANLDWVGGTTYFLEK